jgi:hypothetical protein
MKMHLNNILNQFDATETERLQLGITLKPISLP